MISPAPHGPSGTDPLWTGLALVAPLRARVSGTVPAGVGGVSIDSRSLQPGDLYCAITGDNANGHRFVEAAFAAGAAAAVVDEAHADALRGLGPLYIVADVLESLNALGHAARARTAAQVIAVTGSVGKTSTKEALRLALTPAGAVHASVASYNNHWGVPLTLARMPRATRFAVCEIGMNHSGEILPLAAMVRPHVAIVTTVGPVHLEFFPSVEAIADAKAEIFSGLEPGGTAILNRDNPHYERLAEAARRTAGAVLSFGAHSEADARLVSFTPVASHSLVSAEIAGRPVTFRLGAPGSHLAENALAVLLAAHCVGADVDVAAAALAFFQVPEGRGARTAVALPGGDSFTLIDESFNANPTSMRAALASAGAASLPAGARRVAVLGDMLELGSGAPDLHVALAAELAASGFTRVLAAGPLMRALADALPPDVETTWRASAADLMPLVLRDVQPGDVVLVKGSKGSRMGSIVGALKERHDAPAPV